MFKCPYCNKREISFFKKMGLVRHNDICFGCGKPIKTSLGITVLVALVSSCAFFVILNFFKLILPDFFEALFLIIIVLITQTLFVPIKRSK